MIEFLSIPQAAQVLGIGRNQAYRAAHEGILPVVIVGKRMLVPSKGLDALADEAIERAKRKAPLRNGDSEEVDLRT